MHNNYNRLFEELVELVSEQEVQENLECSLRQRVEKLMQGKGKQLIQKTVSELSKNDMEQLFTQPESEDISRRFQNIVLRESNSQQRLNGKLSFDLPCSKRSQPCQLRGKSSKVVGRVTSSDSRRMGSKSGQRSSKDLTNSNSNAKMSGMKHKSGSKSKSILNYHRLINEDKVNIIEHLERNSKVMKVKNKSNKENIKPQYHTKQSRNPSSISKVQLDSDNSYHTFTKNKSNSITSRGREALKKLAAIDTAPSRFSVSSNGRTSYSLEKERRLLETIEQKLWEANEEKRALEETVQALRERLEGDRCSLTLVSSNIAKLNKSISKIEATQKERSTEVKVSRKKSESMFVEARHIEQKRMSASKNNDIVDDNIVEEQYLIEMYKKVIEEMKSQLKVEQQQKSELTKRLATLRNSEKMIGEKYFSRQSLSQQIFSSMRESLKKWG